MALSETFNTQDPMAHDMRVAAMQGDVTQLGHCLSDNGTNPNIVHIRGKSKVDITPAIVLASGAGQGAAVNRLLVDPRTDPNITDVFGRSAMMEAMFNNETAIVRALAHDPRTDMTALLEPDNRLLHDVVLYEREKVADILGSHPEHGKAIMGRLHDIATRMNNDHMVAFCAGELGTSTSQRKNNPAPKP